VSNAGVDSTARELARGLLEALTPALAPGAPAVAMVVARDVAQVLSLAGLDRVLAALEPHAGHEWPAELRPMIERLTRLADRCREESDPEVFRRGDLELSALAAELEGLEWSARQGAAQPAVPTLALSELLADWRLEPSRPDHGVSEVRLTAPIAAALRAALDWLFGARPQRSLAARVDDGALELSASGADPAGFAPAHHMLAFAGGSLFPDPTGEAHGRWTLRVPAFALRATYLMLEHGGFRLALPWHAVLRVHIRPGSAVAPDETHGAQPAPTLAPLAPLRDGNADRPFALVGLGLKRAWLPADRLIWRLAAEPSATAGNPPAPGWSSAVRTDEGELYWLADPALLLRDIEAPLPAITLANERRPAPRAPRASEPVAPPIEPPANVVEPVAPPVVKPEPHRESPPHAERQPSPLPRAERRPTSPPRALGETRIPVLHPADVEPLPAPLEYGAAAQDAPSTGAGAVSAPISEAPGGRRVLVAEDSIIARIFLTRTLEHEGLEVFAVSTAAELFGALAQDTWNLVCVDVELPDGRGADLLRELLDRGAARERVVALVRDAEDVATARAAGVTHALHKPFERDRVLLLLESLGLVNRSAG